jgi:hypothetical protein
MAVALPVVPGQLLAALLAQSLLVPLLLAPLLLAQLLLLLLQQLPRLVAALLLLLLRHRAVLAAALQMPRRLLQVIAPASALHLLLAYQQRMPADLPLPLHHADHR